MMYHNPVLLEECIKGLKINPEGTYIDVTFGGGGHSKSILDQLKGGNYMRLIKMFVLTIMSLKNQILN